MAGKNTIMGNELFPALLAEREEAILLAAPAGEAVYFNPALARFCQHWGAPVLPAGAPAGEYLPAGWRQPWREQLAQALAGRATSGVYELPSGEFYELSSSPVRQEGQVAGVALFIRDITSHARQAALQREAYCELERQAADRSNSLLESYDELALEIAERSQVEVALQETKERLTQIVQGTSIPTFVIDDRHVITHWNKACEVLTGFGSREMVGTQEQWKAFYLQKRPTLADLVMDQAANDEIETYYANKYRPSSLLAGAYEAEDFFDMPNGGKWLFFTAAPMRNLAGEVIGAVETLQDITTRKRLEKEKRDHQALLERTVEARTAELKVTYEQLLHAEKLSAVGKLASSIAHEFGNPVIGIRNFLQGLGKRAALDPTDAEMLELAIRECQRVKELISNLQDFNRPTSGDVAPTDIHRAVEDILLFWKKSFKDKNIVVEKIFAPNVPLVPAVADQIKQVILNCLKNAEDAIPARGGTITIRSEVDAREVRLQIRDSGQGIRAEDLDHIFDPFFSTKPSVEGTGLGLSVSYGIIKRHGGRIEVQSTRGKGATFTICLPLTPPAALAA